jgi:hypothetical protein
MAKIYRLHAQITYAFRGESEGYQDEIRMLYLKAVEQDLDLEIGDLAAVPPLLITLFTEVKADYLQQFARTTRRFSAGLFGALVIDPTVISDPSLLQPGLFFGYNLSDAFTLAGELRVPLSLPIWGSIRGQLSLSWYPVFNISKISTAAIFSYLFSLDNLLTYTHSLTLSGHAEAISRSGWGLAGRAELARIDLILGLTDPADLPDYNSFNILGESFLRVVFANVNFYIFYVF